MTRGAMTWAGAGSVHPNGFWSQRGRAAPGAPPTVPLFKFQFSVAWVLEPPRPAHDESPVFGQARFPSQRGLESNQLGQFLASGSGSRFWSATAALRFLGKVKCFQGVILTTGSYFCMVCQTVC